MQDLLIGSITLIVALAVSLSMYKKLEPSWFRLFPWFLLASLIIQTIAYYYSRLSGKSNHFIFNIYILIEYGFYMLICYLAINKILFKRLIMAIAIIFILFYCSAVILFGDFYIYNTSIRNLGALLSFFCCILFLAEILMSDEIRDFFVIPMFWIVTGIMITNLGTFLYFSFFNYILKNNLDPDGTVYIIMTDSLSIIEFGFFSIGFLCKRIWKKTR